jgi:uncharacterized protein YciI
MPLYAITYEHPNEAGWRHHILPHIGWLQDRLADGSLIASGPFNGEKTKSALLIMSAADGDALALLIASDPFSIEGLIENMTVREWDPIFGAFNIQSSMPGQIQTR